MYVGVAQIDITPPIGVPLCGFAARTQPSVGVLDPLYARALYLEQQHRRLLWIHADLLGLHRDLVRRFRDWAGSRLDLSPDQVVLSATHTHAGPATVPLIEAGGYNESYVDQCAEKFCEVACLASLGAEPCELVSVEGYCDLAVDRRSGPSAHTDPRVAAVGWRDAAGRFVAVVVNYAMHGVALGPDNLRISGDVPGRVAEAVRDGLPGEPIVLTTPGACGNLNPPARNVPFDRIETWGRQIADAVIGPLRTAMAEKPVLASVVKQFDLPVDGATAGEIDILAEAARARNAATGAWPHRFERVVERWRHARKADLAAGRSTLPVDLTVIRLGRTCWVGVSAEVFSRLNEMLRAGSAMPVYAMGYVNGVSGYLPTREAYEEGGYEVDYAWLFYDTFRPRAGALEYLAREAATLMERIGENA